jgi:hypothetical protein
MKYVKIFESFSGAEYEIDKIYENWKSENMDVFYILTESRVYEEEDEEVDWLDDGDLTSGEKAALTKDMQIISKPQLSALYLKALGKYEFGNLEDKGRSIAERTEQDTYVTGIPGIQAFCNEDWRTKKLYIGTAGLADALGLESKTTVSRTANKFYLILTEGGGTHGEIVYKKLMDAYNFLKDQPVDVIQSIAEEAIQDPSTSNVHRSAIRARGISKEQGLSIGKSIHSLFKDLIKNPYFDKDVCKVQRNAIARIGRDTDSTPEELKSYYKAYLMKEKLLDQFNWCK